MGISDRKGRENADRKQWRQSANSVTWSERLPGTFISTIESVTESGGAILFAKTRDGSSLLLKVFHGNDGCQEYLDSTQDIDALLEWVRTTFG